MPALSPARTRPLDGFSEPTRAWFTGAFAEPTPAQEQAWASIGKGDNTLVVAPTGSGKTLAAFLWAIDKLITEPPPEDPSCAAGCSTSRRSRRWPWTSSGTCARR
jgi:Lhr-like helicase